MCVVWNFLKVYEDSPLSLAVNQSLNLASLQADLSNWKVSIEAHGALCKVMASLYSYSSGSTSHFPLHRWPGRQLNYWYWKWRRALQNCQCSTSACQHIHIAIVALPMRKWAWVSRAVAQRLVRCDTLVNGLVDWHYCKSGCEYSFCDMNTSTLSWSLCISRKFLV